MKRLLLAGCLIIPAVAARADDLGECSMDVFNSYLVNEAASVCNAMYGLGSIPWSDNERLKARAAECFSKYPKDTLWLVKSAAVGASTFWKEVMGDGYKRACNFAAKEILESAVSTPKCNSDA